MTKSKKIKKVFKIILVASIIGVGLYFAPQPIQNFFGHFIYGLGVGLGVLTVFFVLCCILTVFVFTKLSQAINKIDDIIEDTINKYKNFEKIEFVDEWGHPVFKLRKRKGEIKTHTQFDYDNPPVQDHKYQDAFNAEWGNNNNDENDEKILDKIKDINDQLDKKDFKGDTQEKKDEIKQILEKIKKTVENQRKLREKINKIEKNKKENEENNK